jgi:hypothetical protein
VGLVLRTSPFARALHIAFCSCFAHRLLLVLRTSPFARALHIAFCSCFAHRLLLGNPEWLGIRLVVRFLLNEWMLPPNPLI